MLSAQFIEALGLNLTDEQRAEMAKLLEQERLQGMQQQQIAQAEADQLEQA
jgi:Spy/CpxP family protein refolding chaperone